MSQVFNLRQVLFGIAAFAIFALGSTMTAKADSITIVGQTTGATANVNITSLTNTTLTFSVQNTSQGIITGVGFNLPAGSNVQVTSGSGGNFYLSTNPGNVPQNQGVTLEFALLTGNNGNFSGGNPQRGIAAGGTVVFTVTGNFAGLTQQQLLQGLFVRFQGLPGGGSDVGVPGAPVPEPATMILLGTGLAGVGAAARRRRKKEASSESEAGAE